MQLYPLRLSLLVGALLAVSVIGRFGWHGLFDRHTADQAVIVTIAPGMSSAAIANELAEKQIISSAVEYRLYSWLTRSGKTSQAGIYTFKPGISYRSLTRQLALGTPKKEITITVIEGWDLRDITARLTQANPVWALGFQALAGSSTNAEPFALGLRTEFPFLRSLGLRRSLEGYLFPDTYRVWEENMPENLVKKQLETFESRVWNRWQQTPIPAPLRSFDEVLTLASIIEREVHGLDHRKHVAGIFLGRLADGMPLQSDATLSYLTNSTRARANSQDLADRSPYNTYKYRGLPPSPIGNPSAESIQAVFEYEATADRYFLTDKKGEVLYARTFAQHQVNRARAGYNR